MTIQQAHKTIVKPALEKLGPPLDSFNARFLLLVIGQVESRWEVRDQDDPKHRIGPATGFMQFERRGGCAEVCEDFPSKLPPPFWATIQAEARAIGLVLKPTVASETALWTAFTTKQADILHALCGRGLLYITPGAIPRAGSVRTSYDYYRKGWRPGKPSFTRWSASYAMVMAAIGQEVDAQIADDVAKRGEAAEMRMAKWGKSDTSLA